MKPSRMTICGLALFSLSLSLLSASVLADNNRLSAPEAIGKVALLPFGNLTDTDTKYQIVVEKVQFALDQLNIVYVSTENTRSILRKHRIRSRGKISQRDALMIKDELGVDLILVGSIDMILENEIPEFSLSLRLISPDNIIIKSAVSVSASGWDYTKLFDVGTVEEIDRLIELVAGEAVKELFERFIKPKTLPTGAERRWAVLAFDNSSDNRRAGQIMANWLISDMVTSGYQIVEPGTIERLFQPHGGATVGGIDIKRANLMNDSLGVTYIITGEIDLFHSALGVLENSKPELTFGARISDSRSGLIVTSYESESDGDQFETIFRLGRYHTIGKLAPRIFENMLGSFEKSMVSFGAKSK